MKTVWAEGWGAIRPGDIRQHYYRNRRSLCGKVECYGGPLGRNTDGSAPQLSCKACARRVTSKGQGRPRSNRGSRGVEQSGSSPGS